MSTTIAPNPLACLGTRFTLLIGLALLALTGLARAAVTAYEPFSYATGNFAAGTAANGSGFTGNWTCGAAGTIIAGLTYSGLTVSNNALSSSGSRQFVSLASSFSSGTKYISFLFKTSAGNPGANINGVYFPNGNATCLWFGFGLSPYSGTQGQLGLGYMTTAGTAAASATSLKQLGLGTYGTTYLIVLKIDFDTAGVNDTVTVFVNPVAGQATPGVSAAGTNSTYDVGTISGVGLNVQGAGSIMVDEIHVGDTYGDVVGYVDTVPDAPTRLTATIGANLVSLSWTASSLATTYNVKRSTNSGATYITVGTTTAPTIAYDDSVLGGQTYYYVVSAVHSALESTNSVPVVVTPSLAPPITPTGLMATAGNAQAALSWTSSAFATNYTVKRATASAGPFNPLGTTNAPAFIDSSGLNNGTTYFYVVSATGAGGTSADSSPVSATPVGPMPLIVNIARGAGITWFASNSVTYQIQWTSALLGTNTVWSNLRSPILGNGATNTVFDPVGPPHNAYQVLSIQ